MILLCSFSKHISLLTEGAGLRSWGGKNCCCENQDFYSKSCVDWTSHCPATRTGGMRTIFALYSSTATLPRKQFFLRKYITIYILYA